MSFITYVGGQINNTTNSGSSQTTGAFTAIAPGDAVALTGQVLGGATLNSVTDNAGVGNSYVIQQSALEWSTFGVYLFIVTGINIQGKPTTFTFNFASSVTQLQVNLDEFANVDGVNFVTPYANIATANPGASGTTTLANCALLAPLADAVGYTAVPSGYTLGSNNNPTDGMVCAYLVAGGAAGLKTATWTDGAGANAASLLAFSPLVQPGPPKRRAIQITRQMLY